MVSVEASALGSLSRTFTLLMLLIQQTTLQEFLTLYKPFSLIVCVRTIMNNSLCINERLLEGAPGVYLRGYKTPIIN